MAWPSPGAGSPVTTPRRRAPANADAGQRCHPVGLGWQRVTRHQGREPDHAAHRVGAAAYTAHAYSNGATSVRGGRNPRAARVELR
ncbi:hypothetical protein HBB16_05270 [Pseudonocardia sp. MCCB 268]|nr:hypothetical protein [Pseudonocardia cytotoxica]